MFPSLFLFTVLTLALLPPLLHSTTTLTTELHHSRRLLHQPLFPLDQSLSPPPLSSPSPQPQPKYPFSSQTPPTTTQPHNPFFPLDISPPLPPPPPPHSSTHFATFPANISSLTLPQSQSNSHPVSNKLIAVIVSLTLLSAALIAAASAAVLHHSLKHHHLPLHFKKEFHPQTDNLRLVPRNATPSVAKVSAYVSKKPPPPPAPPLLNHSTTSTSSEFLYLGTLFRSTEFTATTTPNSDGATTTDTKSPTAATNEIYAGDTTTAGDAAAGDTTTVTEQNNVTIYERVESPELRPLPPLPRHQFGKYAKNYEMGSEEDEEFFSPRGSYSDHKDIHSPQDNADLSSHYNLVDIDNKFDAKETNIYDTNLNSPMIENTNFTPPTPPPLPPAGFLERAAEGLCPPELMVSSSRGMEGENWSGERKGEESMVMSKKTGFAPLRPPPPPPAGFLERAAEGLCPRPPEFVVLSSVTMRPKLKPLHWDKVRASSDRSMVWDQLKASSFELNEEMIENLFIVNSSNGNLKEGNWKPVAVGRKQDNRVLDPKKSQNIAILLKALNVTTEEVCEALLEGDADTLGTELLESLMKMSPTKEEERKLLEYKDDSPVNLGPAEKFLKAVLEIPFAFKRIQAILYMANFDSEVEYLKSSFETLETACKELKNSRMFMKLLEAVLRTGNRMNVGTNRGDAHAFKLDTLLKLVDIKGTDGKTTLLHFVVHEILRAEGSCADQNSNGEQNMQSFLRDDVEFRKIGIQVVSGLSVELSSVKKAASMDSDLLRNEVTELVNGITKVAEVLNLNEQVDPRAENHKKFSESMNEFLKKSKDEIINIQVQEGLALSAVKETTKYFHGDSAREEAHRFRIFVVVRDFLSTLDQVCRDVSKINDRTTVSKSREKAVAVNPSLCPFFPGLSE